MKTRIHAAVAVAVCTVLASAVASCSDQPLAIKPGVPQSTKEVVVSVTPSQFTLDSIGDKQKLYALVNGDTAANSNLIWMSANPNVASVDGEGHVQAVRLGSTTITVSTKCCTASATASVTVTQAIASISLTPTSGSLQAGGQLQFTATALDAGGHPLSGYTFSWATSNPNVAVVNTTGLATGLAAGSVTISASAGGKLATAALAVTSPSTSPSVSRVAVTPDPVSFGALGSVTQLAATVYDEKGQPMVVGLSWQTSNSQVATVDSAGRVTSRGVGTALIIATALCCNKADTVTANVTQQVSAVAVTPHSASVPVGSTVTLGASAYDANRNPIPSATFTWTSSNTTVATVSGGVVKGIKAGTAVVRAVSGTFVDSSYVTVTSTTSTTPTTPVLTSIDVTPASAGLLVGDTLRFTAVARDQNGNLMSGVTFTWTSSNTSVMTVNQGLVKAIAAGVAILRATSGSISDSAVVTVSTPSTGGSGYSAPDIASTNFDAGNSSPFTTANGSTTGNTDIVIMSDPTGLFSGKVAKMHFARTSTTQSLDVDRALRYQYATGGVGLGQTIYMRGQVMIPTPASNMALAMRKLIYVQRMPNDVSFCVVKAEGNVLKAEITGNKVFSAGAGSFPYNTKISLEVQITVNSAVGVSDGVFKVWKDGVLVINATNVNWLTSTSPFKVILFGQQTQNQLNDTSILFDEYRYWDNLAISTKRIGP